jgi:cell division protein FtsW
VTAILLQLRRHERALVVSSGLLLLFGFLYALTVSPQMAARMGYDDFTLALRQGAFALAGAAAIIGASFLSPIAVRRVGVLLLLAALVLLMVVLFAGHETKGAQRWLRLGGFSLQPSEFVKPALVIAMAWMLGSGLTQRNFPGVWLACGLYGMTAALLVPQPDYGQTILLGLVLAAMLTVAGAPWRVFALGAVSAALGGALAYSFVGHFRERVDLFLNDKGWQVTKSLQAIQNGGVLGQGPGEGVVKITLPDSHADFVYAAATEEFGWLASLGFLGLYAAIAWFGLRRAARLVDPFQQFAATGLIFLFTAQAAIHIAVNASLLPAKGITLPLVSYGGSAMLGSAITIGFAFALLRDRPGAFLHDRTQA